MPTSQRPRRMSIVVVATVAAAAILLSACGTSDDEYEQQIADLESQLEQTQADLEESQAALAQSQEDLASSQDELQGTTTELTSTQAELASTQAALLDAQAQLAQVGELVLEDGTYNGQVLAARATPYRVILFDSTGAWRVAQVADDVYITAGGDEFTLSQFSELLQSTNPDDIKLANGPYKVTVKQGLVTTIRKSK